MKQLIFIVAIFSLSSCFDTESLEKQVNKSTNEINDAITRISANGEDMTNVLNDLKTKLPKDVKEIISVDIDRMVKTTTATAGAEFRCEADFLQKRIVQGLRNLQIQLYNKVHKDKKSFEIFTPTICNPVPTVLDLNVENKFIQIYGYDYNSNIKLYAINQQGAKRDISSTINKPSDYLLTVTTNESLLKELENYKELQLEYKDKALNSMSIIPKRPKICEEIPDSDVPSKIDFYAQKCNNEDAEFAGHGPIINSHNRLFLSEDKRSVMCEINFTADEKDGGSCGSFRNTYKIYTAKTGYQIKEILSPTTNSVDNFEDTDHADDNDVGANGFIKEASYRGDHKGADIGSYTGATLYFSTLRVTLVECCNNCVDKSTIQKINLATKNEPELLKNISKETQKLIKQVKK